MISLDEAIEVARERVNKTDKWDTLIVNRRKPHTFRAFTFVGDTRICLHSFSACKKEEAFAHPHPWPSEMIVLDGIYDMWVGYSADTTSEPKSVIDLRLTRGSIYRMHDQCCWHTVHPVTDCWSIMINDLPWNNQHDAAPTTRGKDLDKMTDDYLFEHLAIFKKLLEGL